MIKSKNIKPNAENRVRKIRNDIILLCSLLLTIIILTLFLYLFSDSADTVTVTIDGRIYATYSLNENITLDIKTGKNNEEINRLVIENGKAYISYATCPDGICANHRAISRTGESIICLPHKVVVSTNSNNDNNTPDIVA